MGVPVFSYKVVMPASTEIEDLDRGTDTPGLEILQRQTERSGKWTRLRIDTNAITTEIPVEC